MPCFSLFQGLETYGSLVETPFLSASRDYFQLLEVNYTYLHAYDSVFIHHSKNQDFNQPTNKNSQLIWLCGLMGVDFLRSFGFLRKKGKLLLLQQDGTQA